VSCAKLVVVHVQVTAVEVTFTRCGLEAKSTDTTNTLSDELSALYSNRKSESTKGDPVRNQNSNA